MSTGFANLQKDIELVEKGGADYVHVDIMDGQFIPSITLGPDIVQTIRPVTKLLLDVHLMIVDPENYALVFAEAGANIITVHIGATPYVHRAFQMTRSLGVKAGVVINPGTLVSMIKHVLPLADQVLVVIANPGLDRQSFIEETVERIVGLADLRREDDQSYAVEINKGIVPEIVEVYKGAGADVLVAGSYTHGAENPVRQIEWLKGALG